MASGRMRTIMLGSSGKIALISDEDFDSVSDISWSYFPTKRSEYARATVPILIFMHRFILQNVKMIDHKDGNGLNNQRENLRPTNHSLNAANSRPQIEGKSEYRGVTFDPFNQGNIRSKRWRARISVNGTRSHLGFFDTPEEAALIWNEAAKAAWGEHAFQNIVWPPVS